MDVIMVCARATEPLTVRGSNFDQHCFKCGARVMMAPSSQRVFKETAPKPRVICLECLGSVKQPQIHCWAATTPEELAREKQDVIPNMHVRRN